MIVNQNPIIFFSHSLTTYNTYIEDKCLEYLKRKYPEYEIINPRYIEIKEPMNTPSEFERVIGLYILPIVRASTLLAYYKDDSYSPGVDMEIVEATRLNIPILNLSDKL